MLEILGTYDRALMIWLHGKHIKILDHIMPFITDADNWILPILLLIVILGFKGGKRGKIALSVLIISLSITDSICAQILKPFFERIRPSHIAIEGVNLLVSKGGKWSMPSNHASNMFSLAVILTYFYDRFKVPLFSLATLIAISRVYVGVHYPADVVVGAFIGYSISWLIITLWVIIKMRELKRRQTWVWYESEPPVFKN
tara:strand:- start:755 stop:1354 length:600 start_codon:yes stop_codon:yes gene_type:complete